MNSTYSSPFGLFLPNSTMIQSYISDKLLAQLTSNFQMKCICMSVNRRSLAPQNFEFVHFRIKRLFA